jgi:hypothetical protein
VSSYADGRGEALPWGLVLVEGIVVALFGLNLLVAPGASLFFLVLLLGIYLLVAGIFRIIGIFLDSSLFRLLFLGLEAGCGRPVPRCRLGNNQRPSMGHHPCLYLVGHLGGVPGCVSGCCGPDSRFARGWLGHGGLVRFRHPLRSFLGDQPPDRGGDANASLGDHHAHRGCGSGGSSVEDAWGSAGNSAVRAGALGQAIIENSVKRKVYFGEFAFHTLGRIERTRAEGGNLLSTGRVPTRSSRPRPGQPGQRGVGWDVRVPNGGPS